MKGHRATLVLATVLLAGSWHTIGAGAGLARTQYTTAQKGRQAQKSAEEQDDRLGELKKQVRGILERALNLAYDSRFQLARTKRPRNVEFAAWYTKDVITITNRPKYFLLEQLSATELAAFRAYVNRFYPAATLEKLKAIDTPDGSVVNQKSAEDVMLKQIMFGQMLIGETNGAAQLTLDLNAASSPAGAHIEIRADGGEARETNTISILSNVYRGLYHYSVTMAGYKPCTGELNLVDERGSSFNCVLSKLEASDDSKCTHGRD